MEQFDSLYIYRLSQLGAEQQENVFKTSLSTKKSFSGVKRTLELFSNKKGPWTGSFLFFCLCGINILKNKYKMEVANNNMSWYDTIDRIDAQAFQDAQSMKGFYIGNGQSSIGMLKDSLLRQLKWPNEDDQYAAFGSGKECCRLIREQCSKSKAEALNDGEIISLWNKLIKFQQSRATFGSAVYDSIVFENKAPKTIAGEISRQGPDTFDDRTMLAFLDLHQFSGIILKLCSIFFSKQDVKSEIRLYWQDFADIYRYYCVASIIQVLYSDAVDDEQIKFLQYLAKLKYVFAEWGSVESCNQMFQLTQDQIDALVQLGIITKNRLASDGTPVYVLGDTFVMAGYNHER